MAVISGSLATLMLSCSAAAQCRNPQIWIQASFASLNYPNRFIRHSGFLGYLSDPQRDSVLEREDATFDVMPGMTCRPGIESVSLRSRNYPRRWIRHQDWRIKLHEVESQYAGAFAPTELFLKDASFEMVPGLAGRCHSFRSVNYPDRYIRHRNFELWLDAPDGTELYRQDATFCRQAPRAGYYPSTPTTPPSSPAPQITATVVYDGAALNRVLRVSGSKFTPLSNVSIQGSVTSVDGLGQRSTAVLSFASSTTSSGGIVAEVTASCPAGTTTTYKVTARDDVSGRVSNETGAGC